MMMNLNDELTWKIRELEQLPKVTHKPKASISLFDVEPKKDASTSCIDLIDVSSPPCCNECCVENVVVETCDDLIAKENIELKEEVGKLTRDLRRLKGKNTESKGQLPQDNRPKMVKMVKKLEGGETVTYYSCHQEGHKSYECKTKKKKVEKVTNSNAKSYLKVDKKKSTPYILKKKKDDKVVAHKVNKQRRGWTKPIWVPKEIIATMKGSNKVWIPKVT
jgi:hypothetical protein